MFPHPETGELVNGIAKCRYTHDAMIDLIIGQPTIKQNDLAAIFDRSPGWVSVILATDAFKARLEERRKELIDPSIVASIQERLTAIAEYSLQGVLERLSHPGLKPTDDFLLKSAEFSTKALGYGARISGGGDTNVAVVVQVPAKSPSATEWVVQHAPSS